ncbi:putative transcription factor TFIIB, brf1, TBP-binding domain-containing protein [Lupinus albus]|uniref:Putative transcription factor TFIIB, brf1, TBP-binding domain-containing protein n=1 Tax=Lupinus albus TaxID=3870 RepID=A0A6A4R127_LUPAL|nr:putative transcription factor TFIIB, brf1, TBP-binding domain-containing protein [Lupinus albus]
MEDDMNENDESETLSDIDDDEIDGYLFDEKAKHYKKIIWENVNRKYLKEQAEKASVAPAMAKSRKRRAQEAKSSDPSQSAVEATRQCLSTKRLSSKINYDRLRNLFDEPEAPENPKKVLFDLPSDNHDNLESKLEDKLKDDELGSTDEIVEETYGYGADGYNYDDDGYGYNNYDDD